MFKPQIDKNWLLQMIELEGDGFVNVGGICSQTPENHEIDDMPEKECDTQVKFRQKTEYKSKGEA